MAIPDGRATYASGNWVKEFDYKDHLGNTRVSFKEGATGVVQTAKTDFDPWGVRLNGTGVVNSYTNRWEMQGHEKEMTFNLNRVNFGARVYNPTIGRWDKSDPAAEMYYGYSNYNYVLNNPLSLTDPNGMWVEREGGLFTNNRDDITAFIDRIRGNGGGDKDKDKNKASITRQSLEERNKEILSSAPKLDALTGFWEKLDYYLYGRTEENIVYDIEGNAVKVDYTSTGAPDLLGGLKGAAGLLKAVKTGAKLSTNGIKLAKQLASEAQMAEKGITIIGPGKLKEATRLAQQYGGNAADWVKKSSSSFTKNGTTFETHWYENISTGVRTEFKTKFP